MSEEQQQSLPTDMDPASLNDNQRLILKLIGSMEALRRDIQNLATNPAFIQQVGEGLISNAAMLDRMTAAIFSQAFNHEDHEEKKTLILGFEITEGQPDGPIKFYRTEAHKDNDFVSQYVIEYTNEDGSGQFVNEGEMNPKLASALVTYYEKIKGQPVTKYPIEIGMITGEPVNEESILAPAKQG